MSDRLLAEDRPPIRVMTIAAMIGILLVFGLYLAVDGGFFARRFFAVGAQAGEILSWTDFISKRTGYIVMHTVAVGIAITLCLSRHYLAFIPIHIALYIATAFDLTYYFLSNRYALVADIGVLADAAGNTSDAVREYGVAAAKGVIGATVFYAGVILLASILRRSREFKWAGRIGIIGLLFLFGMHYGLGFVKGDMGLRGFPRGYSAIFAGLEIAIHNPGEMDTGLLHLQVIEPKFSFEKIIVIMDESIIGSEFHALAEGLEFQNTLLYQGPTYSAANNSASSNYYFRKAARINGEMTQISSIFELAKKSGFRTVYIDNQGVLNDPGARNYMNSKEMLFVDEVVKNYNDERFLRDPASLKNVLAILGRPGREFVYINKLGAHVPYDITIPVSVRTGDRREDYRRSVLINSVDYMRRLASSLNDNSIVVYTADHGQNFGAGPTHANLGADAAVTEWDVPFAVSSGNHVFMDRFREMPLLNSGYVSHFDIAEMIRNLLGFRVLGATDGMYASGAMRTAGTYCAYFGPPYSSFGSGSRAPKCRTLTEK